MAQRRRPKGISDEEVKDFYRMKRHINRIRDQLTKKADQYKAWGLAETPMKFRPPKVGKSPSDFKTAAEFREYVKTIRVNDIRSNLIFKREALNYRDSFIKAFENKLLDIDPQKENYILDFMSRADPLTILKFANMYNGGRIGFWYYRKDREVALDQLYNDVIDFELKTGAGEKRIEELKKEIAKDMRAAQQLEKKGINNALYNEYITRAQEKQEMIDALEENRELQRKKTYNPRRTKK